MIRLGGFWIKLYKEIRNREFSAVKILFRGIKGEFFLNKDDSEKDNLRKECLK